MGAAFIIIYSVIVVVFIVLVFILGLFTHLSPALLLIMMYGFLLFVFIMTAGYAGDAAGKTGGKNADAANKKAHSYYTWAAVISWIIVGMSVIILILGILIAIFGGGEAAAAGGAAEAGVAGAEAGVAGAEAGVAGAEAGAAAESTAANLAKQGVNMAEAESIAGQVSYSPEGKELESKIAKEKHAGRSLFDTGKGFSKFAHYILYILLGSTIALSFTVGLLLAIGASIQGGSTSMGGKKGLKKAAIGATMSMFVSGMYVVLFIVMWARGRSLHKRLEEDLSKHEELARNYLTQEQQAKGQFARNLIYHHAGIQGA